jgi:SAM-dependent methyltransferase
MPDDVLPPIERWLDDATLGSIYSSGYWNDLTQEKDKEWWIADGSEAAFARLRSYLERSGLMQDYRIAERFVAEIPKRDLAVADLATGIGWTASLLSGLPNVGSVEAVDISQHRLELLFPQAMRMFGGVASKLRRRLGSFYELGLADASIDVAFLASAFHHAANPLRLLTEIDRILKPGGYLILIGENFIGAWAIIRRMIKKLLLERRFSANFYELFPPDDGMGDHYYRVSDYYFFSQILGYKVRSVSIRRKQTLAIISQKGEG